MATTEGSPRETVSSVAPLGVPSTAEPMKKRKPQQIAAKLRHVDVLVSQGRSVADALRQMG
jgi:hypothetical protein